MDRSRSNSPALRGSAHVAGRREQSRHSRKRSKSPNNSGSRKSAYVTNQRSKTFTHSSRHRSTSRTSSASRSPSRGNLTRSGQYSPLHRRDREKASSSRRRRRMSSASPSPINDRSDDAFFGRKRQTKDDEELSNKIKRDENMFDRKILAKIKIIVPNVGYSKDDVDLKRRKRLEKGILTLEQVLQLTQRGVEDGAISRACYSSQEFETPAHKELRKIQIEIRRTIPRDRISTSPVRRSLRDPSTVVFTRGSEEGIRPIFDRDEIKHWIPDVPEKRLIAMIPEKSTDYARKRSLSPIAMTVKRSMSREKKDANVRSRLGTNRKESYQSSSSDIRGKNEDNLKATERSNIRARLGKRTIINEGEKITEGMDHDLYDEEKVLDRNELERLRYANSFANNSWDTNPESVPRGNYFEHDNRDNDSSGGPLRRGGRGQRGSNRRGFNERGINQRHQRGRGAWHPYDDRNNRSSAINRGNNRRDDRRRMDREDRAEGSNSGYYRPHGVTDEMPILRLPHEMMAKIFSHVPYSHLLTSVSLVCKKFHQIISEDRLLITDLEINISSYSNNFEEQSMKTIDLLTSAKCLRYLTIHVNDRLCAMLQAVGENCKQLRGLKILYSSGNFISLKEKEECSSHLISIANNCTFLKELRLLINCSFYTMDLINQMLVARQDTLEALEIDSFKLNRDVFHHIANCDKLEELKLPKFTRLHKSCFNILSKKMANIKILELCVRKLSDEQLAQGLAKCNSLEELTLHEADKLSKQGMHAISNLSALKKLQLNILSRGLIQPNDLLHPFDEGSLDNLEYLQLTGHLDISDYALISIIEKHGSLKGLELDGCNNVTVECFRYLHKKYPKLRPLRINNHSFPINEGIMENLKSFGKKVVQQEPYVPYVFKYRI